MLNNVLIWLQVWLIKLLPKIVVKWFNFPFAIETPELIARDIFNKWRHTDRETFATAKEHSLEWFEFSRYVRNTYGMWHSSPTTRLWWSHIEFYGTSPLSQKSKHPDEVSHEVLQHLHNLCIQYKATQ